MRDKLVDYILYELCDDGAYYQEIYGKDDDFVKGISQCIDVIAHFYSAYQENNEHFMKILQEKDEKIKKFAEDLLKQEKVKLDEKEIKEDVYG